MVIPYKVLTSSGEVDRELRVPYESISIWRDEGQGGDYMEWANPEPDQEGSAFIVFQPIQPNAWSLKIIGCSLQTRILWK